MNAMFYENKVIMNGEILLFLKYISFKNIRVKDNGR